MAVTVRSREQRGVPVVSVAGPAEPEVLGSLADGIERLRVGGGSGAIVIDLTDAVLIPGPALRDFVHSFDGAGGDVRFVCARLSGRKALRASCPEVYGSVFGSVDLALGAYPASESA